MTLSLIENLPKEKRKGIRLSISRRDWLRYKEVILKKSATEEEEGKKEGLKAPKKEEKLVHKEGEHWA